ncbi:MAG: OsmC family protein [Ignavibacteriae bacterium]|nr:OsmC family protein [Ignavibacteriota bacterium]
MQTDKSKELLAKVVLINNKLNFSGTADSNPPVSIDYTPPLGDNLGYTSLELFLLSLSSCVGSAVLSILRKMKKEIKGFEIESKGIRKQEHPTGLKTVYLNININSSDVKDEDMEKVIQLSESICPVWSMVKGNVEVVNNVNIV